MTREEAKEFFNNTNKKNMACINKHQCSSCPHPCKSEIQEKEFAKWWASLSVAQKIQVMGEDYP